MKPRPLSGPPVPLPLVVKETALGAIFPGAHLMVNVPPDVPGGGHWSVLIEVSTDLIEPFVGVATDPVHDVKLTLAVAVSGAYGLLVTSGGLKVTEPAAAVHDTVPPVAVLAVANPTPVRATALNVNDRAAPVMTNLRLSFTGPPRSSIAHGRSARDALVFTIPRRSNDVR